MSESSLILNAKGQPCRLASYKDVLRVHNELWAKHQKHPEDTQLWQSVREFIQDAARAGALVEAFAERRAIQGKISSWSAILRRNEQGVPDAILEDYDPSLEPVPELCPYPGLRALREGDAFFGREALVEQLAERLREQRVLAIIAGSGVGKSSLVLAGLLPRLRETILPESDGWYYACSAETDLQGTGTSHRYGMTPGSNPIDSLLSALVPASAALPDAWKTQQASKLASSSNTIHQVLKEAGVRRLVLFVDQLEEVFSLCTDASLRERFIGVMQQLAQSKDTVHRLILNIRSDYLPIAEEYIDFYMLLTANQEMLTPLSPAELERVIAEPAKAVGLKFDPPSLISKLVNEIAKVRSGLPLLQFALRRLWEHKERNRITEDSYANLPTVREALSKTAEDLYRQFDNPQKQVVRDLLLELIALPYKEEPLKRRRLERAIYAVLEAKHLTDRIDEVLQALVERELLLRTGPRSYLDTQIEIAHETLIREWDRFYNQWIPDARQELLLRARVESDTAEWVRYGKQEELLTLKGDRLEHARQFVGQSKLDAVAAEFVNACDTKDKNEQERLHQLAKQAEQQARVATARQLAAQSQLTQYSHRSLLLALASLHTTLRQNEPPVPAAEQALREALANTRGRGLGKYHRGSINKLLITPDNHRLLTASTDKAVRVWVLGESIPGRTSVVLRGHEGSVDSMAITPDNHWLFTGSVDKTVRVWDLSDSDPGSSSRLVSSFDYPIRVVEVSPNGRWLIVATEYNLIYRWDLEKLDSPATILSGHEYWGIRTIAFSMDSHWMLSGGDDHTARLWNLENGSSRMLGGFESAVLAVRFSRDGCWLIAGGADGAVKLWQREHGTTDPFKVLKEPSQKNGKPISVTAMTVAPDSRRLIVGFANSTVWLWDLANLSVSPSVLHSHEDWISAVVVSDDNQWLATCSADKTVRLWNLAHISEPHPQPVVVLRGHERCVRAAAISKDNQWFASCSDDGTVQVANLRAPVRTPSPLVIDGTRAPIAVSPNHHWLATASRDNTVLLVDLTRLSEDPRRLHCNGGYVRILTISPGGHWLAVGTEDPRVFIWNLNDPSMPPKELSGHAWGIRALAFSADSQWLASGSDDGGVSIFGTSPTRIRDQPF